ncbi:alpha/beta hydrolase family protein [Streptomyces sp. RS10V-4]|uniref:alpha/beta hydrolase n=1 Tax=Streptomyces rhizoryzae TaxID=2932493 RepID=UPI002003B79B|nr:alpha/beta hydrolase [Streptomyces rhizoryzae]MCK7623285.1 alpha/beta hydrolase family protein [Streptomyces rhizoryzae]
MPENFTALLKQDFSDLEAAVRSWQKLAKALEEAQGRHRHKVTGPLHASEWQGADAGNAFLHMEASESQLGTAQSDVTSIATVLDSVHTKMREAQEDLRRCVRTAELDGYAVDDQGDVSDRRPCPTDNADADAQEEHQLRVAKLAAYRNDIQFCLDEAGTASWEGMQLLQQVDAFTLDKDYGAEKAEEGARRAAEFARLDEDAIPSKKDPKENARWWSGLTEQQRQAYLDAYPEKIGWLDGIPSTDRDEANRKVVDLQLAEYGMKEENGELGVRDRRNYEGLRKLRDELDRSDGGGDENKRLYVLGVDTRARDGRAVVSQGNPDTARNVAVQVPGTDNDLVNVDEQIERVRRLQDAAASTSSESTAVVSWLGYDAPEVGGSMATTGRADAAAGDLRSFTHGLRESHTGERAHVTVLGHSYGSTVVGDAAAHSNGIDADDVVVVGSPGMTVDHAKDLQMDPGHVWAGWAPDDIVSTVASDKTLGENPAEKEFGGKVFGVDTSGHGGYWDQGSDSLANQGRIIAGKRPGEGDYRVPPQYRPPGTTGPKW